MGLRNLGHLPGEKKLVVNSEPGPTAYARGVGVKVRMDFKTLTSIYDILSVWIYPLPYYATSISGWAGNIVTVLLGYCNPSAGMGKFIEVSAGTNTSDISVFVGAMGR